MYDKQVIRRRRAVLVTLVGLSIVLLTGYFGEGSGGFFHGLQRGAATVLHPIEAGASRAFKPIRDLVNWTGNVFSANSENKRLKSQVQSYQALAAGAQNAIRENQQLRAMLNLPHTPGFPQGLHPLTAQVIVKSPFFWYATVEIDKGTDDGVRVNQPVLNGDGLVGRISATTPGTAVVTLITDASSAVSAEVVPAGSSGIVKPAVGNPDDMRLEYLQKARQVRQGDMVITSGFSAGKLQSIFPRGIPIGRVSRVQTDELALYQLVHIEPAADFRRMDYVQVLTGRPRVSQAQADLHAPVVGP